MRRHKNNCVNGYPTFYSNNNNNVPKFIALEIQKETSSGLFHTKRISFISIDDIKYIENCDVITKGGTVYSLSANGYANLIDQMKKLGMIV